jgi:hypothetical protein
VEERRSGGDASSSGAMRGDEGRKAMEGQRLENAARIARCSRGGGVEILSCAPSLLWQFCEGVARSRAPHAAPRKAAQFSEVLRT